MAGICGPTEQALEEARISRRLGYDLGLLSMGGLDYLTEEELIERAKRVAEVIPIFGFYLQPAVGGRVFSYRFWEEFVNIPGVYAIKLAPFNRYLTLDVVRAICHSPRYKEIALYTGNDDNIVNDLLTTYRFSVNGEVREKKIAGGLLGHWAVWTKRAVEIFAEIKKAQNQDTIPKELLTLGQQITDCNAVIFDARNHFRGCIAGINEILRRQGLLAGNWCLLDKERLSPGQAEEIDRIYREYPHLNDDDFVKANREKWLKSK